MLRRVALVGLLLLMSGIAAIFAAGHFGIRLPWETASTAPQSPTSDEAASRKEAREASKSAADKAKDIIEDTTAALTAPPDAAKPQPGGVEIDISRVSPDGTSVFAGRAEPDTYITVYEDGKAAGSVKADENGEWSLATEHKFASADPKLSFEASKTAPPAPEPPKAAAPAAPPPAAPPKQASAPSVASTVMRKFEKLVEDAREEARQRREAAAAPKDAEPKTAEAPIAEPKIAETKTAEAKTAEPTPSLTVTPDSTPATPDKNETAVAQPQASESRSAPSAETSAPPAAAGSTETADASEPAANADTTPSVIPVPLMFVYNEATLTPEGRRAADLLLEYLTLKSLKAIELTGHADERGTNEYNMDLSRERLETVSALLRQGGYDGELKLTPKGKTEPYTGVDRSAYQGEALYQLDRRVELRVGR